MLNKKFIDKKIKNNYKSIKKNIENKKKMKFYKI